MYYFMDIFYAMGMNIIKKICVKYGQTDDTGKKFCTFDEVVGLMNQAAKEPEHTGNYHDYTELCKLYDKNENGTMMCAELETFLTLMGKLNWKIKKDPISLNISSWIYTLAEFIFFSTIIPIELQIIPCS